MRSLILHSTSTAQWHTVLNEAQEQSAIYLKEDLECYLVFLLMRFSEQPTLAASVLGLDFLHSCQNLPSAQRLSLLREVGDKCLLFAGLFPGRASKRRVKVSYFIKLGQTAYSTLSNYQFPEEPLFISLCQEFTNLMDVLQSIREDSSAIDLLNSLELWHETGSKAAWKRLTAAKLALPFLIDKKNH